MRRNPAVCTRIRLFVLLAAHSRFGAQRWLVPVCLVRMMLELPWDYRHALPLLLALHSEPLDDPVPARTAGAESLRITTRFPEYEGAARL